MVLLQELEKEDREEGQEIWANMGVSLPFQNSREPEQRSAKKLH